MTQIISNNNGGGGGGSYTAGTGIDISVDKEISIDTDVVQTVGNMVENLDDADDTHYPTAKAVKEAISASGGGDVTGPASSTDGDIALFDGATGKIIKDSGVQLSSKLDASAMSNNNYGGAWQGDSTHTPTKGVLYDKIHTMDVEIGNKAADNTVVKLSGNQTINGEKTFGTSPVVPSKSTDATNTGTAIATEAQVYNVQQDVDDINDLIPSAATSSNKLADKNYVNDSINSVAAYYITKNAQGDQWATYAELAAATTFYSGGVVRVPTRNDYTIVLDDENHDNATTRYSYQGSGWEYQYTVNETALTQAQLDALNSGITSGKVSTYDGYATSKQNTLVSGTNIKTINNNSLLGSGDIDVQDTLVSGTNIKTINSQDVLGSGDIAINEVPAGGTNGQVLTQTNDGPSWEDPTGGIGSSNNTYDNVIHLSQADYDNLGTYDSETLYTTPDDESGNPFEPENTGNTGDKLEKTNTGYQWVEGELVELKADNYSAMRGPCDEGFHIPTNSEWNKVKDILNGASVLTYLKMPNGGFFNGYNGTWNQGGSNGYYWSCTPSGTEKAQYKWISNGVISNDTMYRDYGAQIRPFKDIPVIPDSSWTELLTDKVYYNAGLGLISLTNGQERITIADKNLGATVVYNEGDTITNNNRGKHYQWGNNYGYNYGDTVTNTTTKVNAGTYGPGNYYSSSTWFSGTQTDWSSVQNDNLRGGVTGIILGGKYVGEDRINEVPTEGTVGQVLTKQSNGYSFENPNYLESLRKLIKGSGTTLYSNNGTFSGTNNDKFLFGPSGALNVYNFMRVQIYAGWSGMGNGVWVDKLYTIDKINFMKNHYDEKNRFTKSGSSRVIDVGVRFIIEYGGGKFYINSLWLNNDVDHGSNGVRSIKVIGY